MDIVYSNRRKTYRFPLNKSGLITISDNRNISEPIEISNISYDGIQIVFSNNNFLIDFFESYENIEYKITTLIEFDNKKYVFENKILWIRLYNLGEKSSYVLSGLNFVNKENYEESLMDLLLLIDMEKVYI